MAHWHVHVPQKIIRDPHFAFEDFSHFSVQLPKVFHHSAYFCTLWHGHVNIRQLSTIIISGKFLQPDGASNQLVDAWPDVGSRLRLHLSLFAMDVDQDSQGSQTLLCHKSVESVECRWWVGYLWIFCDGNRQKTKSLDQAIPQAELPYHGAMYWLFLKDETFHNIHIWQKYFDLFDTCCFIFWQLVPGALIALAPLWMYLLATILGTVYHNVTCHASIYVDLIMFYHSDVPWRARASPAHPLKSCIDVCVLQYALWTGSHIFSFANHFGSKQYRTWPQPSFQLSHCCDSAVLQSPQRAIPSGELT